MAPKATSGGCFAGAQYACEGSTATGNASQKVTECHTPDARLRTPDEPR